MINQLDGWLTMNANASIRHDYNTTYHANKMRERKAARLFKKYKDKVRRDVAFIRLREFDERLEKIKSDLNTDAEFNKIIEGNTKNGTPADGPKHRADRLTLGQRLYAWWCIHVF